MKPWLIGLVSIALVILIIYFTKPFWLPGFFLPKNSGPKQNSAFVQESATPATGQTSSEESMAIDTNQNQIHTVELSQVKVLAENLVVPWDVAVLPDESLLVSEREGRLLILNPTGRQVIEVQGVLSRGEGGLLGVALHPYFASNNWLYVYLTSQSTGSLENRVERYTLDGNVLSDRQVILDGIPAASNHDGGKVAFGPDSYLYITTGDAQQPQLAQNTQSLAGKILRVQDDGSLPSDNPFNNAVYSYGHRNVQGIAWDAQGQLWAVEHGPSGAQSGNDEVNAIVKGGNYGWPDSVGQEVREGTLAPIVESGQDDTWAPAGLAIVGNQLFFTGLRGEALFTAEITGTKLRNFNKVLAGEYGRLRALTYYQSALYMTTSNRDGRGRDRTGDDQLLLIPVVAIKSEN